MNIIFHGYVCPRNRKKNNVVPVQIERHKKLEYQGCSHNIKAEKQKIPYEERKY